MEKGKYYHSTRFSPEVIREAHDVFLAKLDPGEAPVPPREMSVSRGDERWSFDTRDEFLAECGTADGFLFDHITQDRRFWVKQENTNLTHVALCFPTRPEIEAVLHSFERHLDHSRVVVHRAPVRCFVGHGRDPQWRDLKDHLHELHGFEVIAYEIGPRAGQSVKEVLEGMLNESSFALLLLTGEDQHTDGELHARQNVVHELGLFQGRLGFTRAIALLEEGVAEFSNILGVNQIRFSKGNIRETFGDVVATIRREFQREPEIVQQTDRTRLR